jgi:SAM-dependent methyltransferase
MPFATRCPVCASPYLTLHIDGVDEELTLANVGSSRTKLSHGRILRCGNCRFAFRAFRPTEDELAQLYANADVTAYERELPYRKRTALTYHRIVSRHFPTPGSILDIGCASGFFLKGMADAGWKVCGIEPSAAQFQLARETLGPDAFLLNTTLQEAQLTCRFDAITFWDVLEHMSEPVSFLACCASLLKPDGRVFFTVPNIDSWIARLMGNRWPMLLAEHVNHFTPKSVRLCCERGGLGIENIGLRAVNFSVDYVFYRLGQHSIKGMNSVRKALSLTGMGRLCLPVYMGDMVCRARLSGTRAVPSGTRQ